MAEYLAMYGVDPAQIKVYNRFYGFSEVRVAPGVGMADQMVRAARALPELVGREHRVRYLIQARTMPVATAYPEDPLHEARTELGLSQATTFCLSQQACASGLLAVEMAGRLLNDDGDPGGLALVLIGEKTFTSSSRVLSVTAVMGEGMAAVLVGPDTGRDRVLSSAVRTDGTYHEGPRMSEELHARFGEQYAQNVVDVVLAAVHGAGLSIDDIDLILPHHVNRLSWLRILRLLGVRGSDRLFLDNLATLGHCFGADPFINYRSARDSGRLRPGQRYVMTSVGLGATFSAMVLSC